MNVIDKVIRELKKESKNGKFNETISFDLLKEIMRFEDSLIKYKEGFEEKLFIKNSLQEMIDNINMEIDNDVLTKSDYKNMDNILTNIRKDLDSKNIQYSVDDKKIIINNMDRDIVLDIPNYKNHMLYRFDYIIKNNGNIIINNTKERKNVRINIFY